MTENERIKLIRKSENIHMTMEEFGKRLGVTKSAISYIESGKTNVSEQIRLSVCREFRVNEQWLRTGEGEMFTPDPTTELDAFAARHGLDETEKQLIRRFVQFPKEDRERIIEYLHEFAESTETASTTLPHMKTASDAASGSIGDEEMDVSPETLAAIDREVEEYRQELLKKEAQSEATNSTGRGAEGSGVA